VTSLPDALMEMELATLAKTTIKSPAFRIWFRSSVESKQVFVVIVWVFKIAFASDADPPEGTI
jgi:hypothetical protein